MTTVPVLAICNHKGGAGKTTTAWHLARHLAIAGLDVLAVDLDDQGTLTSRCFTTQQHPYTIADVLLREASIEQTRLTASVYDPGSLQLLPADARLSWAAAKIQAMSPNHLFLARALQRQATGYDLIVLDCPPSAGIIIVNALMAATHIVIPATPTIESWDGALRMAAMLDDLADIASRRPVHLGIVATQVVANSKSHGAYLHQFGPDLLGSVPLRVGIDALQQLSDAYAPIAARIWTEIKHTEAPHAA